MNFAQGFLSFAQRVGAAFSNAPSSGALEDFDGTRAPAREGLGLRLSPHSFSSANHFGVAPSTVFLGLIAHVTEDGTRYRVLVPADQVTAFRAALRADIDKNGKVTKVPDGFHKMEA